MATSEQRRSFESDKDKDSVANVAVQSLKNYDTKESLTVPLPPTFSPEQERALYRKLDMRVMLISLYSLMLPFSDRTGNGNITLVNPTTYQVNVVLGLLYIPLCLLAVPGTLVLKKFRPSLWIPLATFVFGIMDILTGLCKTFEQAIAARIFMGLVQAVTPPVILFYLTFWYPRNKLGYRFGLVHVMSSVMSFLSGVFPAMVQCFDGYLDIAMWGWVAIITGIVACIIGLIGFKVVADGPATAGFLTEEERAYIIWQKKYDNSDIGESQHFNWGYVSAACRDWQVWMHVLNFVAFFTPLYSIALFMSTVNKSFGLPRGVTACLVMPPFAVSIVVMMIFANLSDRVKMRSPFIYLGLAIATVGYIINIADVSAGAKYFGVILCATGLFAGMPSVFAWPASNLSGEYKRGTGMGLQAGLGNVAGLIANFAYQKGSPRYITGHATSLAFIALSFVSVTTTIILYKRANAEKDRKLSALAGKHQTSAEEVYQLGDKALDYRYML